MASISLSQYIVVASLLFSCGSQRVESATAKNVLFLVVDDLRPELGVYYDPDDESSQTFSGISTPNIDALAAESLLLRNAFTQFAVCCPSRSSYMTSRRPDTTQVFDKKTYWRDAGGDFTTIPQYFKENGYTTVGMGKIYHPGSDTGDDDPVSWSDDYDYFHASSNGYSGTTISWDAISATSAARRSLPDAQLADQAITVLGELSQASKPFFLAVGFQKPHLPFTCPEEFFNLYPEEDIGLVNNPDPPNNMPEKAWNKYSELRAYEDVDALGLTGEMESEFPDDLAKELRRGYYACVSYIDSLVGDVLSELDVLGLRESTVVSLVGDHGWQLGEHGEWTKNTNFDVATKVPMMIRVPGLTDGGLVSDKLVELVDLFPTLVDLVGLSSIDQCPEPSSDTLTCTEGSSMMTLITDGDEAVWKDRVFSQMSSGSNTMGYSLRTREYRYTEWVQINDGVPNWSRVRASELYDLTLDPAENFNRAEKPAYQDVVLELSAQLQAGWIGALPSSTSKKNSPMTKANSLRSFFRSWWAKKFVKNLIEDSR